MLTFIAGLVKTKVEKQTMDFSLNFFRIQEKKIGLVGLPVPHIFYFGLFNSLILICKQQFKTFFSFIVTVLK